MDAQAPEPVTIVQPGPDPRIVQAEIGLDVWALANDSSAPVRPGGTLKARVDHFEAGLLREVLDACGGNRSEAARQLQVSRMTLVSKLKKHGLD